jgi:hypothetical protein
MFVSSLTYKGRENVGEGMELLLGLEYEDRKNLTMSALLPSPVILTYI